MDPPTDLVPFASFSRIRNARFATVDKLLDCDEQKPSEEASKVIPEFQSPEDYPETQIVPFPSAEYLGSKVKRSAFVLAWLSLTFGCHLDGRVMNHFAAMAVKIAKGSFFPLAPFFLGTLYHYLDLLVSDEVEGCNNKVIYSTLNVYFLQMFLWECFPRYADKGVSLSALKGRFDGWWGKFLDYGPSEFSAVCNWFGKKLTGKKAFREVMDMEEEFCWRPYTEVRSGNVKFVRVLVLSSLAEGKREEKEILAATVDNFATCFVAGGLPYWSFVKHGFCTAVYQPQRVRRQFGLDQRVPFSIPTEIPWDRCILCFTKRTAIKIFSEGELSIADRSNRPSMTPAMVKYWSKFLQNVGAFMRDQQPLLSPHALSSSPEGSKSSTNIRLFSLSRKVLSYFECNHVSIFAKASTGCQPMLTDKSEKSDEAHELATDVAPKGALRRSNRLKRDKEINDAEIIDMTEDVPENEDSSQAINNRRFLKRLQMEKGKLWMNLAKVDIDPFVNAGETSIAGEQVIAGHPLDVVKTPPVVEQVSAGHPLDADKTPPAVEQVSAEHPLDAGQPLITKQNSILKDSPVMEDLIPNSDVDADEIQGTVPFSPSPSDNESVMSPVDLDVEIPSDIAAPSVKRIIDANPFEYSDEQANEILSKMLEMEIVVDVPWSAFAGVSSEMVGIGHIQIHTSELDWMKKILATYPEALGEARFGLPIAGTALDLLCCVLREMDNTPFHDLSHEILTKWSSPINNACRLGLKVDFALDHLKTVAHAFLGGKASSSSLLEKKIILMEIEKNEKKIQIEAAFASAIRRKYVDA
ncbi:hypothetical protein CCACVL1_08287 [Corchorus capsularis]|uniref:Aminotransferase-like plant mobile domain-containing protein n=1 Tax=Corchorus capsularis TaxID=210143 RepID=A0A1R3J1E0_COCAP|nr:hypothetical protein CCACVL1_08287 [Corchorus capsularis]